MCVCVCVCVLQLCDCSVWVSFETRVDFFLVHVNQKLKVPQYNKHPIMPQCVLDQVPGLYPNPPGMPYLGHNVVEDLCIIKHGLLYHCKRCRAIHKV